MTDNETKLIARLKETAAAFSMIAGLLNGTVAATSTRRTSAKPAAPARRAT